MANVLANGIFGLYKRMFEKGSGSIVGSKRLIRNYTVNAYDMTGQIIFLLGYLASLSPLVLAQSVAVGWLEFPVLILQVVYFAAVTLKYYCHIPTLECYYSKFNTGYYGLATGLKKSDLKGNAGLIGEYRSYVLSRMLKIPHRVLFNVCVPMPNGNFQEVDCIIITAKCICVLECKNRGGYISGNINDKIWIQRIGSQVHEVDNFYLQNQKHTMAIEQFLLDRGILENGVRSCVNICFSTGDLRMDISGTAADFICGDLKYICKKMNRYFGDDTGSAEIIDEIYEELLPYALYTKEEREAMIRRRTDIGTNTNKFALGEFVVKYIDGGIPELGITTDVMIRFNNVYTQMLVGDRKGEFWLTRTDIPERYIV